MPRALRTIEVVMLVFSIPAVLTALTRIMLRRHRMWADDACALVSLLALIVQIAAVFIYTEDPTTGVVRYYMIAVAFYTVIWTSRLSLLFSVIRIDPNKTRRKWLYGIGTLYVVACLLLITQLLWICEHEPQWKTLQTPQCHLTLPVGVSQLTTDILADGTLLLAPMLLFRTLNDRRLSRRLMAIFSTCVITTIVSLVHAAFLLRSAGLTVLIAGVVEDCISLVVCNIPVIGAAIVRHRNRASETNRQRGRSFVLTTIAFRPNEQGAATNANTTLGFSLESDTVISDKDVLRSKLSEDIGTCDNQIGKCSIP